MESEFEGEFLAEGGNVRASMTFDGVTVRFTSTPDKIRKLVAAMVYAADEADGQLPSMSR